MTPVGAGGHAPPPPVPGDSGRRERFALASARVPFRVKLAVVWLVILLLLTLLFGAAHFDVPWMQDHVGTIAKGLRFTVLLAAQAIVLAVALALLGALGRLSRNPIAFGVTGFYTSFFRGTPLIVQLALIYSALPQVAKGLFPHNRALFDLMTLGELQVGVLGLGLNYGAYMTEIFRAGIQSVGHGQTEAAEALGMTYSQKMRRVILPQAIRVIIPPTGNEFIAMMKDTALVTVLGLPLAQAEIFRRADLAGRADARNLEALVVAASLYWALTSIFTFFQVRLERRMSRGYVRAPMKPGGTGGPKKFRFLSGGGAGGGHGAGQGVILQEDGDDGPSVETV